MAAAPPPSPVLRAQEWTAPSATLAHELTSAPGECLARSDEAVETGRALFRAPVLFGGPAARVGLSCEACHAGGRINRHFLLAELGDAPGTVDVTSEWASKVRGDGVRNPVPIPDLVGAGARTTFGARRLPTLDAFVHGVIVEEFQGTEPPPAALAGVLAYVRALDPAACPAGPQTVTLAAAASDVRRALAAAAGADPATASLLLYAGQDGVARIVERLPRGAFAVDRRALAQLARELGDARVDPAGFARNRAAWDARFDGVIARIARRERRTYFNERMLAAALR